MNTPLTSLVEPSLSHNTDFIHAGAEHSLDWEGAADKLVEIVQTVPIGQVPDSESVKKKKDLYNVIPRGKEQKEILLIYNIEIRVRRYIKC